MAAFNAVACKSAVEADAARLTIEVAGVEEMDYSYLGPIGREHYGNENGNGVLLPDGSKLSTIPKTNWPNYPDTSDGNKGKGKEVSINYLAIRYNK